MLVLEIAISSTTSEYIEPEKRYKLSTESRAMIVATLHFWFVVTKERMVNWPPGHRYMKTATSFPFRLLVEYLSSKATDQERRFFQDARVLNALVTKYEATLARYLRDWEPDECVEWLLREPYQFLKNGYAHAARNAA